MVAFRGSDPHAIEAIEGWPANLTLRAFGIPREWEWRDTSWDVFTRVEDVFTGAKPKARRRTRRRLLAVLHTVTGTSGPSPRSKRDRSRRQCLPRWPRPAMWALKKSKQKRRTRKQVQGQHRRHQAPRRKIRKWRSFLLAARPLKS